MKALTIPSRRQFALTAGASLFSVVTGKRAVCYAAADKKIAVDLSAEFGTIRPDLHGHFAEHLGNCVYGGMWVGKGSPIPNINGHRKQAVEYLRALGIPVLRWPGGCFADDYHWRDGIGPVAKRPRRVNLWWGQYTEDNSFGTHEFIEFCRLIDAEPYLAGNVGSGTPQELREWVEYCNFPEGSTLSDERAANGSKQPFKVKYWGVGNENWGCGGRMTADEYAAEYRRYANFISARGGFGASNFLIACGPSRNDLDWTRRFFTTLGPRNLGMVQGYAMHFYSRGKNQATKFTVETMRDQFATFSDLEKGVLEQHELMRSFDKTGRIGLLIDEWGVWDSIPPEDEKRNGRLWQQIPMRSAVAAALGLNVFHRQADKLIMGNIAQLMNVLHSLLLTQDDRCIRTSTYYAFELMKPHRGNAAVRVENPDAGLSVSASRKGSALAVTLVNPSHDTPARVQCAVNGGKAGSAAARVLHHADFNACNTFEQPDTIVPRTLAVQTSGSGFSVEMPPLSIVTAEVKLG